MTVIEGDTIIEVHKRLLRSGPPSAECATIQAFLQQQNFLIAFDASKLLLCFQKSGGGPAQRLISFAPTLYVSRHPLHRRQARFDRVGGGQFPPQHPSYTQAMDHQRFFQPFLQAPGSSWIDALQLPEDFLQRLFSLRVVVHRVRIAHPPIVVFLAVLRQILLHISPLVNLTTLHFHLIPETRSTPARSALIHPHQLAGALRRWIQREICRLKGIKTDDVLVTEGWLTDNIGGLAHKHDTCIGIGASVKRRDVVTEDFLYYSRKGELLGYHSKIALPEQDSVVLKGASGITPETNYERACRVH